MSYFLLLFSPNTIWWIRLQKSPPARNNHSPANPMKPPTNHTHTLSTTGFHFLPNELSELAPPPPPHPPTQLTHPSPTHTPLLWNVPMMRRWKPHPEHQQPEAACAKEMKVWMGGGCNTHAVVFSNSPVKPCGWRWQVRTQRSELCNWTKIV